MLKCSCDFLFLYKNFKYNIYENFRYNSIITLCSQKLLKLLKIFASILLQSIYVLVDMLRIRSKVCCAINCSTKSQNAMEYSVVHVFSLHLYGIIILKQPIIFKQPLLKIFYDFI